MPKQIERERLKIEIHDDRPALGRAAAQASAAEFERLSHEPGDVVAMFAAAPSQNETHAALRDNPRIDWTRIVAVHMDEYLGISPGHPASFRGFLRRNLFDHVPVKAFHGIEGDAPDAENERRRYAALLLELRPQFCIAGIGENGHLAFNDPPADFNDPEEVKVVNLDRACREQQVHDGCFATLDEVPQRALTVSVPALMRIPRLILAVPGKAKAAAVKAALDGPVTGDCPASILRRHPNATLYLDRDSAALL
jgi:glucosamine-6-phosphate deaminase